MKKKAMKDWPTWTRHHHRIYSIRIHKIKLILIPCLRMHWSSQSRNLMQNREMVKHWLAKVTIITHNRWLMLEKDGRKAKKQEILIPKQRYLHNLTRMCCSSTGTQLMLVQNSIIEQLGTGNSGLLPRIKSWRRIPQGRRKQIRMLKAQIPKCYWLSVSSKGVNQPNKATKTAAALTSSSSWVKSTKTAMLRPQTVPQLGNIEEPGARWVWTEKRQPKVVEESSYLKTRKHQIHRIEEPC